MAFDGHGTILEMSHHAYSLRGVFSSVRSSLCSDCSHSWRAWSPSSPSSLVTDGRTLGGTVGRQRLAFRDVKLWLIDVSSGPVSWLLLPPSFSRLHREKLPGVMEVVSSQAYPNSILSPSLHALSPHGKSFNFCEPQLLHL